MKPYILLSAILCIISCTPESISNSDSPVYGAEISSKARMISLPANPLNPYDFVGSAYGEIQDYLIDHPEHQSMPEIFNVCHGNTAFQLMYMQEYTPISNEELEDIFTAAETDVYQYINSTSLTEDGKANLIELIDNLVEIKNRNDDYDAVYNFLISYESTISETDLQGHDLKILLITSSILRNSYYVESRKRRKDRDWELSIGHIAATAYGAEVSEANSITSSLGGKYALIN